MLVNEPTWLMTRLKPRGWPEVNQATFIAAMPPDEAPMQQR
jgi:hypothetical protein|eukprot:COSAG01_NODE_4853_length_4683_cov_6.233857_2_plen_41_part_00